MGPAKDPQQELRISQGLLRQVMRRLQGLPPGHRVSGALKSTANGLAREVEWWDSRTKLQRP